MKRLSSQVLSQLPQHIQIPAYGREAHGIGNGIGIVHLGIGAFHRAHQAVYTDDVLARDGGDWAIAGVSLRSPAVHDQLTPQDNLYSVTARSGSDNHCRIIGAVRQVIYAPEERAALLALMAARSTRIVSLTVTEKGYYRDPASGSLLAADPAIIDDLAHPEAPSTAIGYLVRALDMRRRKGTPPFTVMSCDNLPDNGISLRLVVLEFAGLVSAQLAGWIEAHVAFPCTMVDRIVPAITDDGLADIAADLGLGDQGAVITEPFSQWVIEDNFPLGRPAWQDAGAMLVNDVAPYELIKLRLLNGPHSSLAYLGYLSGFEYVSDCLSDAPMRAFITALMHEEIKPTLSAPPGFDVDAYIAALLGRFSNPSLHHRCWQIAMDGTQKLPQRLLGTIRDRLAAGQSIQRLALSVAAWVQYASGCDLSGNPIDVRDPLADALRARLQPCQGDGPALADAALKVADVFGADLAADPAFAEALTDNLSALMTDGAQGATKRLKQPQA